MRSSLSYDSTWFGSSLFNVRFENSFITVKAALKLLRGGTHASRKTQIHIKVLRDTIEDFLEDYQHTGTHIFPISKF